MSASGKDVVISALRTGVSAGEVPGPGASASWEGPGGQLGISASPPCRWGWLAYLGHGGTQELGGQQGDDGGLEEHDGGGGRWSIGKFDGSDEGKDQSLSSNLLREGR